MSKMVLVIGSKLGRTWGLAASEAKREEDQRWVLRSAVFVWLCGWYHPNRWFVKDSGGKGLRIVEGEDESNLGFVEVEVLVRYSHRYLIGSQRNWSWDSASSQLWGPVYYAD